MQMPTSFHPPQRTLMGPGPSDVAPRVLQAMAGPTLGHLDPAFVGFMDTNLVMGYWGAQQKRFHHHWTLPKIGVSCCNQRRGVFIDHAASQATNSSFIL